MWRYFVSMTSFISLVHGAETAPMPVKATANPLFTRTADYLDKLHSEVISDLQQNKVDTDKIESRLVIATDAKYCGNFVRTLPSPKGATVLEVSAEANTLLHATSTALQNLKEEVLKDFTDKKVQPEETVRQALVVADTAYCGDFIRGAAVMEDQKVMGSEATPKKTEEPQSSPAPAEQKHETPPAAPMPAPAETKPAAVLPAAVVAPHSETVSTAVTPHAPTK